MPAPLPTAADPLRPRSDPEALLVSAVRRRDHHAASRLVRQWVHRRGLRSLQRLGRDLEAREGTEAALWLDQLIGDPAGVELIREQITNPLPVVTSPVATSTEPVVAPQPVAPLETPSLSWAEPLETELGQAAAGSAPQAPVSLEPLPLPEEWLRPLEMPATWTLTPPGEFSEPLRETTLPTAEGDGADNEGAAITDRRQGRSWKGALTRVKSLVREGLSVAREALQAPEIEPDVEHPGASSSGGPDPSEAVPSPPPASRPLPTAPPTTTAGPPAPVPSGLEDLRSWLPATDADLPRAS